MKQRYTRKSRLNPKYLIGDLVLYKPEYSNAKFKQAVIVGASYYPHLDHNHGENDGWTYVLKGGEHESDFDHLYGDERIIKKLN